MPLWCQIAPLPLTPLPSVGFLDLLLTAGQALRHCELVHLGCDLLSPVSR